MKYLFWLVLIIGGIYVYRKFTAQAQSARIRDQQASARPQEPRPSRRANRRSEVKTISMVQCEHCHTHLPEHEALIRYGHAWCNEEHERLGPRV